VPSVISRSDFPQQNQKQSRRKRAAGAETYTNGIVANYGWIRSGMLKEVEDEPRQVIDICHKYGTAVKTNFETDTLT